LFSFQAGHPSNTAWWNQKCLWIPSIWEVWLRFENN